MADPKEVDRLGELRDAFAKGEWRQTLAIYDKITDIVKNKRSLRVEATCLAARALVAEKERSAARSLLKRISGEEYPKAIYYDFLARAYLDLRNYREVARFCERAVALSKAEKAE